MTQPPGEEELLQISKDASSRFLACPLDTFGASAENTSLARRTCLDNDRLKYNFILETFKWAADEEDQKPALKLLQ